MSFVYEWFRFERLMVAARCLGAAERLVDEATAFASERVVGGQPLIERQLVQAMLADSLTELFAARSMTYETARSIDEGVDRKVLHARCSMVKLYASEMAGRVADRAVQIFGGRGYMRENVAERFFRELRVERIWEGASEVQRLIIADQLAKRGRAALALVAGPGSVAAGGSMMRHEPCPARGDRAGRRRRGGRRGGRRGPPRGGHRHGPRTGSLRPAETVAAIRAATGLPLRVMLRAGPGFRTDPAEVESLRAAATDLAAAGADAFVLGFLDADGDLDLPSMRAVSTSVDLPWTCHRAIDHARDRASAWRALQGLPALDTILTAGSPDGVVHGLPNLERHAAEPTDAQRILAGGGLLPDHVPTLAAAGITQFHVGSLARHDSPGRPAWTRRTCGPGGTSSTGP